MPTFKTQLATKQSSTTTPKTRPTGFETGAGLLCLTATYTTTGAEAAGDVLEIGDLPVGAQLLPSLSRVVSEGVGGTTATIAKLGDAKDDDRYSTTAIGLTATGIVAVTPTNAAALEPFTITHETRRVAGVLGLASGSFSAGKKVRFELVYKMQGH